MFKKLLFCFGVGLALGMIALSISQIKQMRDATQQTRAAEQHAPDFVVTQGISREFDAQGQLAYEMAADRLEHYPHIQHTNLTRPKIKIRDQDKEVWLITSEHGTLEEGANLVRLDKNVQVRPEQSERIIELDTHSMTLDTRTSRLTSQQAVTLNYESDKLYSIGLVADLNLDKLWLISNVIATHDPEGSAELSTPVTPPTEQSDYAPNL